jgi:hypothetical protein
VSHQEKCWAVAVDDEHVFWRNADGGVLRAKKDGTEIEVLASEDAGEGTLVLDDTHAFWVNAGTGEVRRIPKAGGASELLAATGLEGLRGLVIDDVNAYFAALGQPQGSTGSVGVVSKQGGSPKILAQDLPDPVVMAADDENLYWTSRSKGSAWKVPKAGGSAVVIAPGSSQSSGIVGFGVAVTGSNVVFFSAPLVIRVPIAGGPQEELFSGVPAGRFLVLDGDRLILGESGGGGRVRVMPADAAVGVVPTVLASVPAHGLAFDADYVYWTSFTSTPEEKGGVYRIRKPKDY